MKHKFALASTGAMVVALIGCLGAQNARSDAQAVPVQGAKRASPTQPANLTRATLKIGHDLDDVITAFGLRGDGENGAVGTIQPGVAAWNSRTGEMIADSQINIPPSGNYTTATSDAGHDSPALVRLSNGAVMVVYGAASTYSANRPPQAWACHQREFCEPFKYAPAVKSAGALARALAQSPEHLLPSVGISEVSYATLGATTVIAGQQQPNSANGQGGAQSFVTLHARGGSFVFDTTAGPWDPLSSQTPPGDGVQMLSRAPNDDAYFDFGIVRDSGGPAQVAVSIGADRCTAPVQASGNAASDAAAIATYLDRRCGAAFGARYGAMQVSYDPALRADGVPIAPAAVGIVSRNEPVTALPPASELSVACSGALSCGSQRGEGKVVDVRSSGLHRHFLWGGVVQSGPYIFYIMDVQQVTGSWEGSGGNSFALALACFRATEPAGDTWTWTDCAGRHPFHSSPAIRAPDRLTGSAAYLIHAPKSGFANGMMPYITDFSMEAQPLARGSRSYPVLSAESAVIVPDGNLLIAHGCQLPSSGITTVCTVLYDTRTGVTLRGAPADRPIGGGSLASTALRVAKDGTTELAVLAGQGEKWGCSSRGICAIVYRLNALRGDWSRIATHVVGGAGNAGFPGTLTADEDGFIASVHVLESGTSRLEVHAFP